MTVFYIILIVFIVWVCVSWILLKSDGFPRDMSWPSNLEEWSVVVLMSILGTVICCFLLMLLYYLWCIIQR